MKVVFTIYMNSKHGYIEPISQDKYPNDKEVEALMDKHKAYRLFVEKKYIDTKYEDIEL